MTYFVDTFTEAAGTPLESHTPDTGTAWIKNTAWNIGISVRASDDVARCDSTSVDPGVYLIDSAPGGSTDYSVQADLITNDTSGANRSAGLILRGSTTTKDYYVFRQDLPNDKWDLRRVVAGVETTLDSIPQNFNVAATYDVKVSVTTDGSGDPNFQVEVDSVSKNWTGTGTDTLIDTDVSAITTAGRGGIHIQNRISLIDNFSAVDLTPAGDSITVDENETGEVFAVSTASGNKSVGVTGSYSATVAPTSIECRILDAADDTTVIVDWAVIDASPSGDVFSGSITVPGDAKWYHAECRFSNDTGVADIQNNDWGVGLIYGYWGQSNIENWVTDGTGTPSAFASIYNGSWAKHGTTGAGSISFVNEMVTATGYVVGVLDYGVGGTQLTGGVEWGSDAGGSTFTLAKDAALTAAPDGLHGILWVQGEADAVVGASEATYQTDLTTLITTRTRGVVGNASEEVNLPFFISQLGRRTSGVAAGNTQLIRNALQTVATAVADCYVGANFYDLPLSDTVHLTPAGYVTHADRMAQTAQFVQGLVTYQRGPSISSAQLSVDGLEITVNITHRGGTDFTPTTGLTGFEVFDDAAPVTILSAVRSASNQITLTLNSAITGAPTLRYMYDANPDITGVVLDNSSLNLPIEGRDTFAVSVGESLPIDSGSYNLTGTIVNFVTGFSLSIDSGPYLLTGTDVTFSHAYKITADPGTYNLTGTNVNLIDSGTPWVIQTDQTTNWVIQN